MSPNYERIKQRDRETAQRHAGTDRYFYLSPTRASLIRALKPLLEKHVHGRILDAGAGAHAYTPLLSRLGSDYVSMDVTLERADQAVVGSILSLPFGDCSFDTVFCSQVLEHLPEPLTALKELTRALKPDGVLILTAPHLSYLHNEPHDYFRFTRHGLAHLFTKCDLQIEDLQAAGGLLSFLGHIPSVVGKAFLQPIPFVYDAFLTLNSWYSRGVAWLDERIERRKLFALNYVVVARKKL